MEKSIRIQSIKSFLLSGIITVSSMAQGQNKRFDFTNLDHAGIQFRHQHMEKVKEHFPFYSESDTWPGEYDQYFHFIDIDNDSDLDLIYDGWSGSEPMMVQIFLNIEGEFRNVFTRFIDIVDVKIEDNLLKQMKIYNPGCCMAIMEHEYFYECGMSKDNFICHLTEHYIYHNETTRPFNRMAVAVRFEVVNSPYRLRITPCIDTVSYLYPDDIKGNLLKDYSKGDRGTAIAKETDNTGRVWWYVIMDNTEERSGDTDDPDLYPPKYRGWMSSRYLKTLD